MLTIEQKANASFGYSGTVSNLSGSIVWGLAAAVRVAGQTTVLDTFECTIAQDAGFATNGLYDISIQASAAQTLAWYNAARNQRGSLQFDLKFYNTAAPEPVLRTDTFSLLLTPPVTP